MIEGIIMSAKQKSIDTRILVVDDEPSMGEFMKIMLGKEGYRVTFESSAQHALQVLRRLSHRRVRRPQ